MADARFFDNRGPFAIAEVCSAVDTVLPTHADPHAKVFDLASLSGAAPSHLTFYAGGKSAASQLSATLAGFCFVAVGNTAEVPPGCVAIEVKSVPHAFAAAARMFYPESGLAVWTQRAHIDPTARIADDVVLALGVVVGPGAEIGEHSRIAPNTVIGRGVSIGRNCEIGSNVSITHAYIGDRVVILPGAQIGQPGFGFAPSSRGHTGIPQLGRVIVQDDVEIGACSTIDRGALGDTIIGEGTKIDNVVHIAHNVRIGRHCLLAAQVGIAGSTELGDFVVAGGQVGIADHITVGSGSRLAARAGVISNLDGGQDYAGTPAKPLREYARELAMISMQAKRKKRT